ncbi:MAG: septum formation protein Maf [Planctomycetes bacterium]|nr:septum formation protein Maf [Planctomycetota bacterium]
MKPDRPESVKLVLASASARRRAILADAGFAFVSRDPGTVEDAVTAAATPEALALEKARVKARAVAAAMGEPAVVIGADTLVALDDEVLGKPVDRADAERILKRLSGTRHRVITGLCLWPCAVQAAPVLEAVQTWVTMRAMSASEIRAYVDSGEADDKAGAYAIQETGDRFVSAVDGSFLNVVGFPLERFRELLPAALAKWGFVA